MKKYLLAIAFVCAATFSCFAEIDAKKNEKTKTEDLDSKPVFDISGSATVHSNFSSPNVTYYDGKDAAAHIKTDQKSTHRANKDSSMARFCGGEAEIVFSAKGTLTNGWLYGAKLALDAMKGDTGIDKMYLIFERNNFGTIHAGNVKGPEVTFLASGQDLLGGTGGVDGTVIHDLDFATGVISPISMIGSTSKATKLVYYSPMIHGFQAGFAITPDTKHHGHTDKNWRSGDCSNGNDPGIFTKGELDKERPSGRNNIAFGLRHYHNFKNYWGTKFSAVMVMEDSQPVETYCYLGDVNSASATSGKEGNADYKPEIKASSPVAKKIRLKNACSYHFTGTVSYKDWSFGAGYLNNGKSRLPLASEYIDKSNGTEMTVLPGGFIAAKDSNSGHAWNIGTKYVFGKWSFAGAYHRTSRKVTDGQKATGNMFTFTTDYLVCSGLKLFVELDQMMTKSCDYACSVYNLVRENKTAMKTAIKKQNTTLVAIGAKVCF